MKLSEYRTPRAPRELQERVLTAARNAAGTALAPTVWDRMWESRALRGRVLGVTAVSDSLGAARKRAYEAIAQIDWPEGFCRQDIGM